MDNSDRSIILLDNFKKSLANLGDRITLYKSLADDDNLKVVFKESIVQTYEVTVELACKTARTFSLLVEPNGKIAGSTTAIKHALSTGIISSDELARTLISAIQDRNISSHEYLITNGLDEYVNNIVQTSL